MTPPDSKWPRNHLHNMRSDPTEAGYMIDFVVVGFLHFHQGSPPERALLSDLGIML